ncbi:unnamed protein product, partial [Polarella glacialis]
VLTEEAIVLGLAFAMRASPRMWLSFNSIGAGASVNHLHMQGFFPGSGQASEKAEFPLQGWPLCGWAFTWDD